MENERPYPPQGKCPALCSLHGSLPASGSVPLWRFLAFAVTSRPPQGSLSPHPPASPT